jgi:hypothetical protein
MANPFFVVQANAMPGRDDELNRWYEEQHLDDCLACKDALSAQRFGKITGTGPGNYAYLALYEVRDPQTFADDRKSKEGTPLLPRTTALALPAHAFFYRPIEGQSGLLARQERSSLYIEFLDGWASSDLAALMTERQQILSQETGLGLTELMLVDAFQERQGWHASGIIFAEVTHADAALPLSTTAPNSSLLRVAESGLYQPLSARRVAA